MAMDSTTLADALVPKLKAKIRAKNPFLSDLLDNPDADIEWFFEAVSEAMAEEIVSHIQTLADVAVNTNFANALPPPACTAGGITAFTQAPGSGTVS